MNQNIPEILKEFNIKSDNPEYKLLSSGHINNTYLICADNRKYILQNLNTEVFKNCDTVMSNISAITNYLDKKNTVDHFMHFHKIKNGKICYKGQDGSVWRLYDYIDGVCYESSSDEKIIFGTGVALGNFHRIFADIEMESIEDTISGFHDTKKRINKFYDDILLDPYNRAEIIKKEIDQISVFKEVACILCGMRNAKRIPVRVTHNDPKMGNVIFDGKTFEPLSLIDLDTVMSGLIAYDFGDSVRSCTNLAAEDECDLDKVKFDINKFSVFVSGYGNGIKNILKQSEIDTLALGAFTITLEQAVRFFDDYIMGDKYYKIKYSNHNLVRGRCQLKLACDMYEQLENMKNIVNQKLSIL